MYLEKYVTQDYEQKKTTKNLKKGKNIYYDIDGRRKTVPHKVKDADDYLVRDGAKSPRSHGSSEDKVPDWLR